MSATDVAAVLARSLHLFHTTYPSNPRRVVEDTVAAGIPNRQAVETGAWCWELAAQVRHLAAEAGIEVALMGGTGAQLRIAVELQRLSADNDHLTTATKGQVASLMRNLEDRFRDFPVPLFRPVEHAPKDGGVPIPMVTYLIRVPTLIGMRVPSTAESNSYQVKLEFHLVDELPPSEDHRAVVFAAPDGTTERIPTIPHQVALKAVTLADPPVGIPEHRVDDIPKQLYDLDQLFSEVASAGDWNQIRAAIMLCATREAGYLGISVPEEAPFFAGIDGRLSHWGAEAITGNIRHIRSFQSNQLPRGAHISPEGWRTRCHRLRVAFQYSLDDDGFMRWGEARDSVRRVLASAQRNSYATTARSAAADLFSGRRTPRWTSPDAAFWHIVAEGGSPPPVEK